MGALVSLTQFYDPPLCCFTFEDFQLAPIIEEFERIMGTYLKDHIPFTDLWETPSLEMIAATLSLLVRDVVESLKVKWTTLGFSIKSLEAKAKALDKAKNWKMFNAVLALLIYGVVLFLNINDYIEITIINIFLAKNPIPIFLIDV